MPVVAGSITVDPSTGTETYTPNDATNASKSLYTRLLAENTVGSMQQKIPGGKATRNADGTWSPPPPPTFVDVPFTITPSPTFKQKQANLAMLLAAWWVDDIMPQLTVTTTIPATTAGDGLQTGQGTGNPTTHPATDKTLTGTVT